jgi:hypothetical protein
MSSLHSSRFAEASYVKWVDELRMNWNNRRKVHEETQMNHPGKPQKLGLELYLQRPEREEAERIPVERDDVGRTIYPELDADGDHVHFEMVPMGGDSLLWLNPPTRDFARTCSILVAKNRQPD